MRTQSWFRSGDTTGRRKDYEVLWERGLWAPPEKLTLSDARERLQQCEDFRSEPSALGKRLLDLYHVLLSNPKEHSELAGNSSEST